MVPLAPCADIIAPPSAGFSAAAIIMALPAAAAGAAVVVAVGAACAPARFDSLTVTGFATYSAGSTL